MKWEQIERQWAAMTRRVQCDWSPQAERDGTRPDEIAPARSPAGVPKGKRAGDPRPGAERPVSSASRAD